MFNSELKERYIRESNFTESREEFVRYLFKAIEKYEEQWSSDICTRSKEEVRPVLDAVCGYKWRSWQATLAYFHRYGEWCLKNVPDATNALVSINSVADNKLKTQMVPSPEHLQEYLNAVFEPESERKIDNTYRCYYWLTYAGMDEDDIFLVKASDVDFLHMIIKFNDYEYPIYEPALPALMNCVLLTSFATSSQNVSRDDPFIQRGDGDVLTRGTKPYANKGTLKPLVSKMQTAAIKAGRTSSKLSYNRVLLSGIFYRMYERENEGFKVSFMPVAAEYIRKNHKTNYTREQIHRKSTEYLGDYKRWKKAFDL